ncbi:hypothetical protein ACWEQ1_12445 [Streptomyces nodosus]
MHDDDREPVFKRSEWGTNRYVYNHRNPVGRALIVLSLGFAALVLLLMHNHAGPFAPTPHPTETWSRPPDMSPWIPPLDAPSPEPSTELTEGP